jgi:hypothetical protein
MYQWQHIGVRRWWVKSIFNGLCRSGRPGAMPQLRLWRTSSLHGGVQRLGQVPIARMLSSSGLLQKLMLNTMHSICWNLWWVLASHCIPVFPTSIDYLKSAILARLFPWRPKTYSDWANQGFGGLGMVISLHCASRMCLLNVLVGCACWRCLFSSACWSRIVVICLLWSVLFQTSISLLWSGLPSGFGEVCFQALVNNGLCLNWRVLRRVIGIFSKV